MLKHFLWALVEKGGQFSIQFLSVVLLSRILSPQEYGTYGIMVIFISISELLIDSGFGGALVHKKEISQADINTLFVSNFAISIILYLIIFISAPFIAQYYLIPELKIYLRILGLTIIFFSMTIVHITLLQRELKLKKSARVTLFSSIISFMFAVGAAYMGLGIWSLIIQPLSMAVFLSGLLWISEKRNISFSFSKKSFTELWSFGSKLLFSNLIQNIYGNISTSVMPKIANVSTSGYYFQSSRINSILVSIIQMTIDKAAFPILSKEPSDEMVLTKARHLNIAIITIAAPLGPLLSLFSEEIIGLVLGPQWLEASKFLQVLAWGSWGLLVQALFRNIFKSVGNTNTILKVDVVKAVLGLLVLALSAVWGITFMIWGITIGMYIGTILYSYQLNRLFSYSFKKQLEDYYLPLSAALFSFVLFFLLRKTIECQWSSVLFFIMFLIEYVIINYMFHNSFLHQLLKTKKS